MLVNDTIVAVATGSGGAISIIRVSGDNAITICDSIFVPVNGVSLADSKGFTLHYGDIVSNVDAKTADGAREKIDDVLVSLFRAPRSYTGENMVEVSCHGSKYIIQTILGLIVDRGARMATAGEFTMRAFLNGRMDLSQAEAVADIIASDTRTAHSLAVNQMRGGYSDEFRHLRTQLTELISLLELELDFSEEDVEFADRGRLEVILTAVMAKISRLTESFKYGNIIKNGVPVAIVGSPNVGKSTLLNKLLNEERAMVSNIAGTTRDVIEDVVVIDGISFRFIDTAGIRKSDDMLENMGIERTFDRVGSAAIILVITDATRPFDEVWELVNSLNVSKDQHVVIAVNKIDLLDDHEREAIKKTYLATSFADGCVSPCAGVAPHTVVYISAKNGVNIDDLSSLLVDIVSFNDYNESTDTIVFNARHYDSLVQAQASSVRAMDILRSGLSTDLLAEETRMVLYYLSLITGEITTDEILGNIFSKFCIGK